MKQALLNSIEEGGRSSDPVVLCAVAKYFTSAVDSCSGAEQSPNAGLKEKLDVMNVYELKQLLSSTRLKVHFICMCEPCHQHCFCPCILSLSLMCL